MVAIEEHEVLWVYRPGAEVGIAGNLRGWVLDVQIGGTGCWPSVTYQIGYWNGNTWTTAWLPIDQVQGKECEQIKIGFAK